MSPFHVPCYSGDKGKLAHGVLTDLRSQLKELICFLSAWTSMLPFLSTGIKQREHNVAREERNKSRRVNWGNLSLG